MKTLAPITVLASLIAALSGCDFTKQKTPDASAPAALPSTGDPAPAAPASDPPVTAGAATYTQVAQKIFQPKCVSCHGGNIQPNLALYAAFATDTRFLTAGNPANSAIYTEVKSGNMPQGGAKLTTAELQLVYDWIKNGAKND